MPSNVQALLQMHFCVLLWGFTAVLGRMITLPADALVLWRVLIVSVVLLALPGIRRRLLALDRRQMGIYAGIGVVIAAHWLAFYGAVKLANASVAATCIALAPVGLSLLDPLIARRPFRLVELLTGLAALPGVALVVGGTPDSMNAGVGVGIVAGLLAALFAALNKRHVHGADALTVTAIEMGAATLCLAVLAVVTGRLPPIPDAADATRLLVLALACTLLPFALSLVALRHLSAFSATLALNLEPVYAIALAVLLLNEQTELQPSFYVGVALILGTMTIPALAARRKIQPTPGTTPGN